MEQKMIAVNVSREQKEIFTKYVKEVKKQTVKEFFNELIEKMRPSVEEYEKQKLIKKYGYANNDKNIHPELYRILEEKAKELNISVDEYLGSLLV